MRTFRMGISWIKGELGWGRGVLLGRRDGWMFLEGACPALGSLLGQAPGVPYSRETCLPVPYQRVYVHLWGASGVASLGWGSSLLPCCPVVPTANPDCKGE